jgi:hypothetical protein
MEERIEKKITSEELSHLLLFAYQMAVPGVLRKGDTISIGPILRRIREIAELTDVDLVEGEGVEEAFENYAKKLVESKLAREVQFKRLGTEKYEIRIEGCPFADDIHPTTGKLKNVTCRHALVAMAILGKFCGKPVRIGESELLVDGTQTVIECV